MNKVRFASIAEPVPGEKLSPGSVGVIATGKWEGEIVIRSTVVHLMFLRTGDLYSADMFKVRPLPPGSVVEIVVGGRNERGSSRN